MFLVERNLGGGRWRAFFLGTFDVWMFMSMLHEKRPIGFPFMAEIMAMRLVAFV